MADVPLERAKITLDDLLEMSDRARIEIIEGEVVEMAAAGVVHHIVAGNIYDPLKAYNQENSAGAVFFDGLTYLMFSDPGSLKDSFIPDVSFIRAANILSDFDLEKPYPGIPDLAVEVISPNDKAEDVQDKLRTYLDKGTEQVWIVYPRTRQVYQYRRDNNPPVRIYSGDARMDIETLFPGLELTLSAIFHLPVWAKQE